MKSGLEGGVLAKSRETPEDEKSAEGWTKRQLCSRTSGWEARKLHSTVWLQPKCW